MACPSSGEAECFLAVMRVVDEAFLRCIVKWQADLSREFLPYSCISGKDAAFTTFSDGELEMSDL